MLELVALITRRFYPRGMGRLLRLISNPDTTNGYESVVVSDGVKIRTNTSSFIEWDLFFRGYYEREITELIRKHFNGGIFVDVGANIGTHSLTAAQIGDVIAFEPIPENAKRLASNAELNGLDITIREVVVSDKPGIVTLNILSGANKSSTVCDVDVATTQIERTAVTLDDELKDRRVGFIKIDTDGHDREV